MTSPVGRIVAETLGGPHPKRLSASRPRPSRHCRALMWRGNFIETESGVGMRIHVYRYYPGRRYANDQGCKRCRRSVSNIHTRARSDRCNVPFTLCTQDHDQAHSPATTPFGRGCRFRANLHPRRRWLSANAHPQPHHTETATDRGVCAALRPACHPAPKATASTTTGEDTDQAMTAKRPTHHHRGIPTHTTTDTRYCPGRCGAVVQRDHAACSQCWVRLPATLQVAIACNAGRNSTAHAAALQAAKQWFAKHPLSPRKGHAE
jgi:hypothetical protein